MDRIFTPFISYSDIQNQEIDPWEQVAVSDQRVKDALDQLQSVAIIVPESVVKRLKTRISIELDL